MDYGASLEKVLLWSKRQDYKGYSKFDAFNSPIVDKLSLGSKYIRMVVSPLWARSPVNLRPWLLTEQSRNPKGIGLFASALIRKYRVGGDAKDLEQARELLSWLDENSCPGYSGKCWGYDHHWQNLHFAAPKYTPNIVVTGNIAYAFLEAFETTGEKKFLETARSSVDFMLKDLETPFENSEMRNISYIPGNKWAVLNINGLSSAIMIWVWQHTGEDELKKTAKKLIAFLVDKQTDYGAWHYAWPSKSSNVKHDNYHTGNVLDWVLDYTVRSGDDAFLDNYKTGLEFYADNLFEENGAPKWRSDRSMPYDVHGGAQAVITFCKAAMDVNHAYLNNAQKTADWIINNLQAPEGCFYYQKSRFYTKKYTLMRWCNAWMAFALATLMETEKILQTKEKA